MKDVKAPTSRSYQEFLLESLRNAQEAAGYIEVTLTEASDEPKLLQMVLKDVVDSRLKFNNLSESAQLQWEKLDKMLSESAGSEIFCFVELLQALGFKLEINRADIELSAECTTDRPTIEIADRLR
ncbi:MULTISPECIES: transcriptional regulator [unclassified Microcoleus]|uniref:transcriptional regulator n=1 Tax=unclassified Microcoleus TaxID=2642155 RepID=UPI002FD6551D